MRPSTPSRAGARQPLVGLSGTSSLLTGQATLASLAMTGNDHCKPSPRGEVTPAAEAR